MVSSNGSLKFRVTQEEMSIHATRPLPGLYRPIPKKVTKEFTLVHLMTTQNWSLTQVDEGVRRGFLEMFRKAGKTYVRIL